MLALFFTETAVGALLALLLVPPREAGRKFFQLTVALCCLMILLGLLLAPPAGGRWPLRPWLLGISVFALMGSAGLFHLGRREPGRVLMAAGLAPALAGAAIDALALIPPDDASALSRLLYPLDALTAGLVPGSVLVAMILGHYYLNVPGLSILHLQRLTKAFLAAVGIRAVVVGLSVARSRKALAPLGALLLDTQGQAWTPGGLDPYVLIFLLLHAVFGVVAPGIMAVMAWRTALIASTQSTTGILYVALLMAIMGEMVSRYLLTLTGLPL